jgi:hypothetical protein
MPRKKEVSLFQCKLGSELAERDERIKEGSRRKGIPSSRANEVCATCRGQTKNAKKLSFNIESQ